MADNFHKTKRGIHFQLNASPINLENGDLWFDGYSFNFQADGYEQTVGDSWSVISTPGSFPSIPGDSLFVDTTAGSVTILLPISAPLGSTIRITDPTASWGTSALIIEPGPNTIGGLAGPLSVTTPNSTYELVFYVPTGNWILAVPRSTYGA